MITTLGSFSAIFLSLWLILSVVFLAAYPFLRPRFLTLHPRVGSALLLVFCISPFFVSLASTSFLFVPDVDNVLVGSHCHEECVSHAPLIQSASLAAFGLALGGLVLASLLYRCLKTLSQSRRLRRQFAVLAKDSGKYQLLRADSPVVFTLGWWRSRIYISEGLVRACSPTDMSIILLHEKEHQERRDNLRLLLARLCSAVLRSAGAKRLVSDLQLLTEQACDFRAAEKFGYVAVAETLLKVKRLLSAPSKASSAALHFAERDVELRVKALLKAHNRVALPTWQLLALAISVVLCMSLLISPLHHGSEWFLSLLSSVNIAGV